MSRNHTLHRRLCYDKRYKYSVGVVISVLLNDDAAIRNTCECLLLLHIREKNFEEFSKHLKGLVELYKLPGDK